MKRVAWMALLLCACVTPPLLTCPEGRDYCGSQCVELGSDPMHCGRCDNACQGAPAMCSASACVDSTPVGCTAPLVDCDGTCVDLLTNPMHCGGCGNACASNASCLLGPSGPTCVCAPGLTGAACTACAVCGATEYLVAPCSPFADTQCAPITACMLGELELMPPTPTSDRVCASCPPISSCLQVACTNPGDAICLACEPGFSGPACTPDLPPPPAPDCFAILQASMSMGDGLYLVDPDGPGPIMPFQTYCDMTNGGWTLLNDQDVNVPPGYQSAAAWRAGVGTTLPNAGQWGVLPLAPAFMSFLGGFDLRLTFGQDPTTSSVTWHQAGDPTMGLRGVLSTVVMVPDLQTSCAGPFAGIADDGVMSAAWAGETTCGLAFAVGTSAAVSGGIPAYDGSAAGALVTDRVRLWVKIAPP